tara:strand:+ start:4092 stop:4265 length:174 start_codon:yes stop_codon:yes gene_type:complete
LVEREYEGGDTDRTLVAFDAEEYVAMYPEADNEFHGGYIHESEKGDERCVRKGCSIG